MTADNPVLLPKQQFAFIHILRGVAALLVVWSHLSGFWLLTNQKSSYFQERWQRWIVEPFHIFQNGGHLGVVLFFLISGYIITHTSMRETRLSFAVKRTMRIVPALVVAVVISAALLWLAAATGTTLIGVNNARPLNWIGSILLLDGFLPGGRVLDVTWTLVVEIIFYLLTFALLDTSRARPLRAMWMITGIWVATTLMLVAVWPFSAGANRGVSIYVSFLLIGRIIYLVHQRLIAVVDALVLGVLVAALYAGFTEWVDPGFLLAPGGWTGIEPLFSYIYALIIFVAMLRLSPSWAVQPLRFLGDISYSLYLLHIPVGITVLNLMDLVGVPPEVSVIVAIAASLGVSWMIYRVVEVPSQRLARRALKGRTKPLIP